MAVTAATECRHRCISKNTRITKFAARKRNTAVVTADIHSVKEVPHLNLTNSNSLPPP
jgi:hypothetical protein